MATPVQSIPRGLIQWRWAGLTYFWTVGHWAPTTVSRVAARVAKEWIRTSVTSAILSGALRASCDEDDEHAQIDQEVDSEL